MKHLDTIEVGILLALVLFRPPWARLLAVLAVVLIEVYKRRLGVACTIRKDLKGKVAIITGANTGIGRETALELARQGCEVVIAARDQKKSVAAMEAIRRETGNQGVVQMKLDLASKQSIDQFVAEVRGKYDRIDYLVNNAGIATKNHTLTADGFQMHMGVNHLGHFYLTYRFWDLLTAVNDFRVINVSSDLHNKFALMNIKTIIDWDDFNYQKDFHNLRAYGRSKLANVLFTQELANRAQVAHPNARIVSLHPGFVSTEISREGFDGKQWLKYVIAPFFFWAAKTPKEGAQTTLYTILEDTPSLQNGAYYDNSHLGEKNHLTLDLENQKKLWKKSEELLGVTFDAK